MALQEVIHSMRHHVHRLTLVAARSYASEADPFTQNLQKNHLETPEEEQGMDSDIKFKEVEGINDVYVTGIIFGNVFPISNNRVTFLLDILRNGRYGPYTVRTKVIAFNSVISAGGNEVLKEGQKILVKGHLGSKVERSPEGTIMSHSTHVVGRFISLL